MTDLPDGWEERSIKDLFAFKYGKGLTQENRKAGGGLPVYGSNGVVGEHDQAITIGPTIIIGRKGSVGEVHFSAGACWPIDTTYFIDQFPETSPPTYWALYLRSLRLGQQDRSSAIPGISREDIYRMKVAVPPVNEQRRIVAKLEEMLGKVDACQKRFAKVPMILKRFRQSVLAAACSGRLTEDWRERHPEAENASAVVEKLRQCRMGKAMSPAERQKLREIYQRVEENDSDGLPASWRFTALSKLCDSFAYGTSAKSKLSGQVPVLRMGNIQGGKIDWDDLVYTSDATEIRKYSLKPGTVLFNRTNSPELVGKAAIYRGEMPAIFAGYLIRINPCEPLDSEYLNYCLGTDYAREFCLRVKTDGVSQSNINAQKVGAFEVPLCSLQEQREIARRIQTLFTLADQIEARYQQAKAQVDQLTQSILAKAFRGELVPTEAELARRESR